MVQLALIGVGRWGKNFISTINSFSDCRIKYICSKTERSLQAFSNNYIKITNYKELFKYPDIDGVIVVTPDSTHYQISKDFLERSFNLLIEKPLAINYQDALRLKLLKDKSKSKVLLGHVYLFDPAYIKIKKLIKEISPMRYLYHEMLNNGPICTDVSVLWHLGPHTISIFLDIFQSDPIQIKAWGFYDLVFMSLKFPNRTQAFAKLSWLSPIKKRELVMVGSNKSIVYSDLAEKKITYFHQNMNPLSKITYPYYNNKQPLETEVREFVDAIKENREVKKSGFDLGVRVTKLLCLAEESIRHNGKVMNIK